MSLATARDVARLFGRAAFGATKDDLARWVGVEYDTVVDSLFPPATNRAPFVDEAARLELEKGPAAPTELKTQRWWLDRMRTTPYPLEERMTWFWHTHFATAYNAPPTYKNLLVQNQTIRTHALGDFRALVEALTVDAAMLYWLSGNTNTATAVNENHARELLELFVAGTIPQRYDENDVKEAAKALTGWYVKGDGTTDFDATKHTKGTKTLGGTTIGGHPAGSAAERDEYKEVVAWALGRDTAPLFVAYKLVASFCYVPTTTNLVAPPGDPQHDELVAAVAAALAPAWSIADAVKALLKHPRFRDAPQASLVRSPVEVTVHLAKAMNVDCDPPAAVADDDATNANRPIFPLRRMGQVPFKPPNVGGWPKGERWLSATTTLGRYSLPIHLDLAAKNQNTYTTFPLPASTDAAGWATYLGLGELDPLTAEQLGEFLVASRTATEPVKQLGILVVLTMSPQWQVM